MKLYLTIVVTLLTTSFLIAQNASIDELVRQGVELHEAGKFNDAIKKYEEALKINENSAIANYEMAVSCMALEMYDYATKYSTIALTEATDNNIKIGAYLVLGSALDKRQLPLDAINVFEEAIQLFPQNFNLYYQLSLSSIKLKDYEKAESAIISAINLNSSVPVFHLILTDLVMRKKARIKSMLAVYYFLMLEPNSDRSETYRKLMNGLFTYEGNVIYPSNNDTHLHLFTNPNDDEFTSAETLLHMTFYSKSKESKKKNDKEIVFFIEMTKELFQITNNYSNNKDNFWGNIYLKKFANILKTDNLEPFCYYISQSLNSPEVNNWIEDNQEKIDALRLWIDLNK